jgi:hypothetical protein
MGLLGCLGVQTLGPLSPYAPRDPSMRCTTVETSCNANANHRPQPPRSRYLLLPNVSAAGRGLSLLLESATGALREGWAPLPEWLRRRRCPRPDSQETL